MTEDQAKTKWCPAARVTTQMVDGQVVSAGNRVTDRDGTGIPTGSRCIASSCMAWRLHGVGSRYGYCGLAGADRS